MFRAQGHLAGWGCADSARRVLTSVDLVPQREFSLVLASTAGNGMPNDGKDESHESGGAEHPEMRGIAPATHDGLHPRPWLTS